MATEINLKSDEASGRQTSTAAPQNPLADPFAVDLFAADSGGLDEALSGTPAADKTLLPHAAPPLTAWYAALPRISSAHIALAPMVANLPVALHEQATATICESLARFVNRAADSDRTSVTLEPIDARMEVLNAATLAGRAVFINLSVEPAAYDLSVAVPTDFAVRLIDCTLGGDGRAGDELMLRDLSVVEQAVIEFLGLNVVEKLNRLVAANIFRLNSVTNRAPAWLESQTRVEAQDAIETSVDTRGAVVVAHLAINSEVECLARAFVPHATLHALQAGENRLLRPVARVSAHEKLADLKRVAPDLPLRVRGAVTRLAPSDVIELERGDVVLTTQSFTFDGETQAFVGAAENYALTGRLQASESISNAYSFAVSSIEVTAPPPLTARWHTKNMAEQTPEQTPDPNAARERAADETTESLANGDEPEAAGLSDEAAERLENLMLTVHIELAARRITLDELAQLQAGQIIELGCQATDPVSLVIDERTVARGDLIDIEGKLGVRLTQIFR